MQSHVLSLLQVKGQHRRMAGIFHLKGTVKHYDWGGKNFIPALLRISNPSNLPFSEYWLGTHVNDKVQIDLPKEGWVSFREYLMSAGSELSYLLKILDVDAMLSIQLHPSKAAAKKGFARENAAGIPLDSPQRNYKDENHKQELMVALGDFWLLQGFRPAEQLREILRNKKEFQSLLAVFESSGTEGLYRHVMLMPQEEAEGLLAAVLKTIIPLYKENKLHKEDPDFWAARAGLNFQDKHLIDRGIFSIYLLNLVHLDAGQSVFQDTGVLHAYLEGKNVEIMSSSDNVLRGGLTTKHIDIDELLKHVNYKASGPVIIEPKKPGAAEHLYETASRDFKLTMYDLPTDEKVVFTAGSTEILLLTEGAAEISNDKLAIELRQGSPAAAIMPGETVSIKAISHARIFRASH